MTETKQNSLGTEPIGRLLLKFSVPTALTLMVNCLYNIVDQIFIARGRIWISTRMVFVPVKVSTG